jgi:flagellar hook assembly protein FlgD
VLFRLPLKLNSVTEIDSIRFIVSVDSNVATSIPTLVNDLTGSLPTTWTLYQNYPNPFNGTTNITFDIPEVAGKLPRVAVQVFDLLGRKVITLEKGNYDAANRYRVIWDGKGESGEYVSSGVYFYRLLGPEYTTAKRMILIK